MKTVNKPKSTINRAITDKQIQERKDEIINSCYNLYLEKGYKETSILDIAKTLTFARTSIYNYYQTKEEIFLELLKKEYELLNDDLLKILAIASLSKIDVANLIGKAISKRALLLQIISTSLNELEKYSRLEFLVDFKSSYAKVIRNIQRIIEKYTTLSNDEVEKFIELFFPFLFGLCAFTIVSERQKDAMKKAGINWNFKTTEELCSDFIKEFIIKGEKNEN